MTIIAQSRYIPRLDLTWPTKLTKQWHCYFDHVMAFFKILGSTCLSNDTQQFHDLTEFDFGKIAFGRLYQVSLTTCEVELLMQNVRNFGAMHTSLLIPDQAGKFAVEIASALCVPELVDILLHINAQQTLLHNRAWKEEGSTLDRVKYKYLD